MRKKKVWLVIVLLVLLLVLTGSYTVFHYFYNRSVNDWFSEECGSNYTVVGKEVGFPILNGKTEAQIELYDNSSKTFVATVTVCIKNGGLPLANDNYDIDYMDDYIRVTLYDKDQKICGAFRWYFDDFSDNEDAENAA